MEVEEAADAIRRMEIRGATAIARTAATALAHHIIDTEGDPRTAAREAAHALVATRPSSIALHNAVHQLLNRVLAAEDPWSAAQPALESFLAELATDEEATHQAAAEEVKTHPRIVTVCHATQVVDPVLRAHRDGVEVHVTCLETRPWGQGRITAQALADQGVPVAFIVDAVAAQRVLAGDVDMVLVGADTVLSDGSLINKIGSLHLALAAARADIPFHSVASGIKYTTKARVEIEKRSPEEVWKDAPPGITVENPVFDEVPADLITGYATPWGMLPPIEAVDRRLS